MTAYSLVAVLRDKGIAAELRPFSNPVGVPWLEGEVWGEILVLEEDLAAAQDIIRKYLESMPEQQLDNQDHDENQGSMGTEASGQDQSTGN